MTATLFSEAAAGRGLWIGLFPLLDDLRAPALVPELEGLATSDDLHCTLVHLGRDASAETVEQAIRAASVASVEREAIDARVGGVARFCGSDAEGDPVVVLLQHSGIRALRQRLVDQIELVPRSYDYTPHVTPRSESIALWAPRRATIRFERVGVVCGDARLFFSMRPST